MVHVRKWVSVEILESWGLKGRAALDSSCEAEISGPGPDVAQMH